MLKHSISIQTEYIARTILVWASNVGDRYISTEQHPVKYNNYKQLGNHCPTQNEVEVYCWGPDT